ncbi:hypothetical protein QBC32DRAFT_122643 [Pseudoneurospora amorphoporcata]|uniref:N-acetylglucosamine-induced protein 1 n=1 Tax=Pseudoneurospora amorphoporcata TaxID=241081 RepID=A0AAN6SG92_9PEZI|nr:hypothetical protein QBC32DRAFT_122643 [Pseudoneurospora amorphoporcata]
MGSLNPNPDQTASTPAGQPYWQINAPPSSPYHPSHPSFSPECCCPPFLVKTLLSPKDLVTICTPNHVYKRDTWSEVVQRVRENKLAEFQRTPADMWRYLEFCWGIKQSYKGGVKEFILRERLKWHDDVPAEEQGGDDDDEVVVGTEEEKKKKGFYEGCEERGDVKILCNDWPYGIDERIVHLVVWTKFELEDDPATGDLTEKARGEIDEYVKRTFGGRVPGENIIWFKNWAHIKSVKAVEHFHVMLFDPDPEFVKEITNGDVPLGIIQTK